MCRTNKIVGQEIKNVSDKMIGCLCEFSDLSGNHKELDILEDIDKFGYKEKYNGYWAPECRPVKPDEVKFYDHISQEAKKVQDA